MIKIRYSFIYQPKIYKKYAIKKKTNTMIDKNHNNSLTVFMDLITRSTAYKSLS
jgi:hypothetical protein